MGRDTKYKKSLGRRSLPYWGDSTLTLEKKRVCQPSLDKSFPGACMEEFTTALTERMGLEKQCGSGSAPSSAALRPRHIMQSP